VIHHDKNLNQPNSQSSAAEEARHRGELLEVRLQHIQRRHAEQLRLLQAQHTAEIEAIMFQLNTAAQENVAVREKLDAVKVNPFDRRY
jgi:hypothetical protein